MKTVLHSGDLGDLTSSLPVIRHLGGAHLWLCSRPWCKPMDISRFNFIVPLLRLQPYLLSVDWYDEENKPVPDINFTQFRQAWGQGRTITDKHAAFAGLNPSDVDTETPWLTIPPSEKHGKIVIVRSARYAGALHYFRIWAAKHQDSMYLGQRDEYDIFCYNNTPWASPRRDRAMIPLRVPQDAVEAAQLIAGSRLYVGNPTCLTWLAEGVKHPNMLVECSEADTEFIRPGVRNVKRPEDNLTVREVEKL